MTATTCLRRRRRVYQIRTLTSTCSGVRQVPIRIAVWPCRVRVIPIWSVIIRTVVVARIASLRIRTIAIILSIVGSRTRSIILSIIIWSIATVISIHVRIVIVGISRTWVIWIANRAIGILTIVVVRPSRLSGSLTTIGSLVVRALWVRIWLVIIIILLVVFITIFIILL